MVAAKDNFLGKYIYKDTLARNLAAVIYRVSFLIKIIRFLAAYVEKFRTSRVVITFIYILIRFAIFLFWV